ncbi:MAG TPA: fluoride efflux transporter CrcB [Catenuloplanes sp.]|jgi:CrcB protein
MTLLLVVLGGAVGAPLRYLVDRAVRARLGSPFPAGTFLANVAGSLLLGVLSGAATALPPGVGPLVGTGFCGALSTYSTFGYETLRLVEDGAHRYAVANVLGSVLAGVGAAFLGQLLGAALT